MDPAVHLLIEVEVVWPPPSGKLSQPFSSLMMTLDFAGLPPGGKLFLSLILQDYLGFLYPGYAHLTSP